jgi:hypothetical protein
VRRSAGPGALLLAARASGIAWSVAFIVIGLAVYLLLHWKGLV